MTSQYNVTGANLTKAIERGAARARSEYDDGAVAPHDDIWDELEQQDLLFNITGDKLSPLSDAGWLLIDTYEGSYYDAWEDLLS